MRARCKEKCSKENFKVHGGRLDGELPCAGKKVRKSAGRHREEGRKVKGTVRRCLEGR
jgi:hypothetical protein